MDDSWGVAETLAQALIYEVTIFEKDKQALRWKTDGVEGGKLPCRYFLHLSSFPKEAGVRKFAQTIETGVRDKFPDIAEVEEIGWLQGSIASTDGEYGSCDGVYITLRVEDDKALLEVKQFLQGLGSGQVSTTKTIDIPRPEEGEPPVADDSGEVQAPAAKTAKVR